MPPIAKSMQNAPATQCFARPVDEEAISIRVSETTAIGQPVRCYQASNWNCKVLIVSLSIF
jgi:hypothetical protein